ncbi:MAG: sigma-70 family RNA polymerase sigma factor [Tannerellaceae bacterium]|nr:sigma-70 family RNA polymerase sigma factor [Tannerellaceae bacterium]
MEIYTDTYYIDRIQKGDTGCFACLLDKYSNQVFSLIMKIVRDREDAEELTQDVFMKVFKNLVSFKGESNFSTWLYRIAYNTAISYTRKKKVEYLAIDEAQITNTPGEEIEDLFGGIDKEERIGLLEKALEQLPPDERGLILLYYVQDKSVEELKQITGLSVSNVKTKLFRIRKKLFVLINEMEKTLI